MWTKTYSKTYKNADKDKIWNLWSDVNNWPKWDYELDSCKLEGPFQTGSFFLLKPKDMKSPVRLTLADVQHHKTWTDLTIFPGAKMYGTHSMIETPQGLTLTATIKVEGLLTFLWVKLVAGNIANGLATQMDDMVTYVERA